MRVLHSKAAGDEGLTRSAAQVQVPVNYKAPSTWTKMSNTKDFNRYYSPEVAKLVQNLKEARERKTTVVNDFQFKVSLFLVGSKLLGYC